MTLPQLKEGPTPAPPALSVLHLEMQVNTTDKQIYDNLRYVYSRHLPKLPYFEAHDKVLAIVGSGPSLADTYEGIPPDCDVLALNGAYKFLQSKGRTAEFFAMLDARECNTTFIEKPDNDTCFFLAAQTHKAVVDKLEGQRVFIFHLCTPSDKKVFGEVDVRVGGGGTIGLTALALAMQLGYRKVILYGFDSSFKADESHVLPQPQNADLRTIDVWVQDRKYRTTHAMAAQTMDFFPFYDAIKKTAPEFEIHLRGSGLFYDFIVTNNHPTSREKELAKYQEAYKNDDYGMTQDRYDSLDAIIGKLMGESYLDVSTGRGETLLLAQKHGFTTIQGTETVEALCNERVIKAILPSLPFADRSFDVVSLIEVIEHLLPADIKPTLRELTRLAKKHILISAATLPHWYGGVNLHPSARPLEEWDALFKAQWGDKVARVQDLGFSPCWLVTL